MSPRLVHRTLYLARAVHAIMRDLKWMVFAGILRDLIQI